MPTNEKCYWAGVDWGDKQHTACVVSMEGDVVSTSCVPHSASGVAELVETICRFKGLAGIAIETSRHVLVDALLKAGITVYAVNPKQSHQWRLCESVAGPKNDLRDARSLAQGLRLYAKQLQPLQPEQANVRVLAMLCEQEQRLIKQRTASVNKLEAALKAYFPAVLPWFSNWAVPMAWKFVQDFPTPEALAYAKKQTLCGWFKRHRSTLTPKRLEQIEKRQEVLALTADPVTHPAHSLRAIALAHQLLAIQWGIDQHRKQIEALFAEIPESSIFSSLPGAGRKLAPRLLSMFGSDKTRYQAAHNLCMLAGTVPIEFKSGAKNCVAFRRGCRKIYRNALHQFAWVSLRYCGWANAFYRRCRREKQSHGLALRNLATKWLNIIFRMWQQGLPYDNQRYLDALKRTNSPLLQFLETVDNPVENLGQRLDFAS
jgi:transposase